MEVFTIVANEVIGLSATECTLMQFSYNPEQIHDPESVLRSAVMDYLKTDEGKRQLEINMCGLCISSDNFHEVIPYESKSILSGLKYNRNDKVTDFHLAYLLNEGRAKNLDSNIYKKREPHVDKLEYEFNKTGDIDFYSGELYLNAIGDVVSGCDWSYKSQKKYRFGNVMNKNWLENISNSELYIAS